MLEEERKNLKLPHVVLPLRIRFKGGIREIFHVVVVTAKSNSGLEIGKWLERIIAFRENRGVIRGHFFANMKGGMMRSKDLEMERSGDGYLE